MAEFMSYDPWRNLTSRNGIPGDELVSALQKSIRRADEATATRVAYEMYITSEQFEDKMWRRLNAISVEDVGFGNPYAPILIHTLDQMRKKFPYNDGDRPLFFVHAIRFLCRQKKERSSDCLKNIINMEFAAGYKPEIPDYAYDMHTGKGREMGRDILDFLDIRSKVTPLADDYDPTYENQMREMLLKEKDGEAPDTAPEVAPFDFGTWQY